MKATRSDSFVIEFVVEKVHRIALWAIFTAQFSTWNLRIELPWILDKSLCRSFSRPDDSCSNIGAAFPRFGLSHLYSTDRIHLHSHIDAIHEWAREFS
jgi:hypothetical protein